MTFVDTLLTTTHIEKSSHLLDPWNGSGTVTEAACRGSYPVAGVDLNPVMVVVARARCVSDRELPSLMPLGLEIIEHARRSKCAEDTDPLRVWVKPAAATAFRSIECAIVKLLVQHSNSDKVGLVRDVDGFSDLASFYYLAMFRSLRSLLKGYYCSNPTWIKRPMDLDQRLSFTSCQVYASFKNEVQFLLDHAGTSPSGFDTDVHIKLNSSTNLDFGDSIFDLVVGSPPYCTRIDYAVATSIELSALGYHPDSTLKVLRKSLMGTSTITRHNECQESDFGPACIKFIKALAIHPSKASISYYLPNHLQYFTALRQSTRELARVLKVGGGCVLVVQDSFYKDIHNDLPKIVTEMCRIDGLRLRRREDFFLKRSMAGINPKVKVYRTGADACESVLCFEKLREIPKSA